MQLKRCEKEGCEKEDKQKNMCRIKHQWFCKKCAIEIRKKHREETIQQAGIKDELKELDRKIHNTYQNTRYRKLNPIIKKTGRKSQKKIIELDAPKIKGSKHGVSKDKSNCYLLLDEKRLLYGRLLKNGLSEEEAKDRIQNLIDKLSEIRKQNKKSCLVKEKANLMEGLLNSI